ncbi:hypothetical protein GIB67_005826 [Kingdonia uniflora]|uniref:Uncharacterized protein n=1 Tax=Kingdonia uniflora TaxID=39325 RepID=A0A7J7LUE5_9MAGN|nr:hypothetical protein GIB67_005826 [Kingdonia uniflora]
MDEDVQWMEVVAYKLENQKLGVVLVEDMVSGIQVPQDKCSSGPTRLINWDELTIPTEWTLSKVVVPRPSFNNQVSQITQTPDGDVDITFASTRIKLSHGMSMSCRMVREENILYQVYCPSSRPSRNSTSEPILKGIWVSDQQIPHGVYTDPSTNTRIKIERERPISSTSKASSYV